MIFSATSYYIQSLYTLDPLTDLFIRAVRMIVGYILPVLFFYRRHQISLKKLGISFPVNIPNLFAGIFLYCIGALVFLKYEIFFEGWRHDFVFIPTLFLIFILVSTTDFWTRGFILLFLADRRGKHTGIVVQNIVWFIIHWYEIVAIAEYTGFVLAIALTLFLGIGGDILTLRSQNIYGLMIGHFIMNLMIILQARNNTFDFLSPILRFIP